MSGSPTTSNMSGHFMNVVKSFVGSNYLAVPHIFLLGGVYFSCYGVAFIALLTGICCSMLVKVRQVLREKGNIPCTTYGQVAMSVLGWKGYALVEAAMLLTQIGFCIGYIIFMATAVYHLLSIEKWVICIALAIPLTALVCVRDLSLFTTCSYIANFALLVGFVIILATDVSEIKEHGFKQEVDIHWSRLPIFFGVLIACFEGIGTVLPVEGAMGTQRGSYGTLLWIVMVGITFLFSTFGVLGVGRYGNQICGIILDNLNDGIQSDVIKICVTIGLFFTYAFQMFPVFEILEGKWAQYLDEIETIVPSFDEMDEADKKLTLIQQTPLMSADVGTDDGEDVGTDDGEDVERHVEEYEMAANSSGSSGSSGSPSIRKSRSPKSSDNSHSQSTREYNDVSLQDSKGLAQDDARSRQYEDHTTRFHRLGTTRVIVLRVIVVGFTVFVAITVPQFELLISFVGSLGASFLAFIVPCLLAEQVLNPTFLERIGLKCILFLGIVFTILGSSLSLIRIIESLVYEKSQSCG